MWPTRSTLHIRDRTAECSDHEFQALDAERIRVIAFHRIHLRLLGIADEDLDAATMCHLFQTVPELVQATGGNNPYAILGRAPDGMIEQCTPLLEMGAHAAVWNDDAIGVAVVGDWTTERPPDVTWHRLKLLGAALSVAFDARVAGHDELAGGSRDADKQCPGRLWPMPAFRAAIRDTIRANRDQLGSAELARNMLVQAGAIFGG